MKKALALGLMLSATIGLQACGWCCGCTTNNSDKLLMLLAGKQPTADSVDGVQFVSAEQALTVAQ